MIKKLRRGFGNSNPAKTPGRAPLDPRHEAWREAGAEPDLEDVLADPLVHLVMRRDGVTLPELKAVVAEARSSLRRGLWRPHAA